MELVWLLLTQEMSIAMYFAAAKLEKTMLLPIQGLVVIVTSSIVLF